MEREVFDTLFSEAGAAAWGCCSFFDLTLSEEARTKAEALCPGAAGVFIAAFSYRAEGECGNLSRYARGKDYHLAVGERLSRVSEAMSRRYTSHKFAVGVDNSPLPERQIARRAGLGIHGRNGLVFVPPYGSWVFLGTILTTLPLPSAEQPAPDCMDCGACVRACPGGALGTEPFDESCCLSALTQKKGALTDAEEALLRAHPLIWGCDICQQVCPMNRETAPSPLPEFSGADEEYPLIFSLSAEDVDGLTNRTFREKYGDRAFAWRGPAVLRRNVSLKKP